MAETSEHAIRNELRTAVEFCVLTHDSRQGGIELPNRLCDPWLILTAADSGTLEAGFPCKSRAWQFKRECCAWEVQGCG